MFVYIFISLRLSVANINIGKISLTCSQLLNFKKHEIILDPMPVVSKPGSALAFQAAVWQTGAVKTTALFCGSKYEIMVQANFR